MRDDLPATDASSIDVAPMSQQVVDEALRDPALSQAMTYRAERKPQAMADELRIAADQGNPIAQQQLGQLYRDGTSVAHDDMASFYWTRLAAQQGFGEAEIVLAELYFAGRGTVNDSEQGMRWLDRAEEQHRPAIWFMAGQLYLTGVSPANPDKLSSPVLVQTSTAGLAKDPSKAVGLFRRAADAGDDNGEYAMCLAQMNGIGGLLASRAEAQPWCDRAAARGNLEARKYSAAKPGLPTNENLSSDQDGAIAVLRDIGSGMLILVYGLGYLAITALQG